MTNVERAAFEHETTRRLHHGQPAKRGALHRRDVKFAAKGLAASHRSVKRFHVQVWMQNVCLVRNACNNAGCHRARKADQRWIEKEKAGLDRGSQPAWRDLYDESG